MRGQTISQPARYADWFAIIYIAVPIIIVIYTQPEFSHLKLNLTNLSAILFGTAFIVVVLWKVYQEFWKLSVTAKKQKPWLLGLGILKLPTIQSDPMDARPWALSQRFCQVLVLKVVAIA